MFEQGDAAFDEDGDESVERVDREALVGIDADPAIFPGGADGGLEVLFESWCCREIY